MKPIFCIVILLLSQVSNGQTVPSSCTAPHSIVKRFSVDAQAATLNYLNAISSTYTDSAVIYPGVADTVLRAMTAVHNAAKSMAACDSVVNIYHVAHYYVAPIKYLTVHADETASFVSQIKNNVFPTGLAQFDDLINKYHFDITSHFSIQGMCNIYLESDSSYNMDAVALEFSALQDVWSANVSPTAGDGGYVMVDTITSTHTDLTYSYGWGDCPSGCMYRRNWSFRVGHDCSVTFIRSTGTPAPPPVNVTAIEKGKIAVYPNPASDILHINNVETALYSIYNFHGRELQSGITNGHILIKPLPPGAYFIRLQTRDITIAYQFIKTD